jgi:uroporphyrin-III C-methyltransferase/precorrin-2 dehydrogenase/sirohydrochlorin ferrochelatase/uroporphyrin-III C-methyltransferase
MRIDPIHIGKVILAGAGPGDPELLTLKALRYLRQADVVIADRLVSPQILREFTRPDALLIPVGKQGNSPASTPQTAISQLLVDHALAGRLVVRLKGGDVSIFSNVLDELETLARHGIPYELVPGITAALGAAAYAGIPLTARGYSTAVRFLTGYDPETIDTTYWRDLAHTDDTLVFYMSSAPLDRLIRQLVEEGIPEDRWIAVVEQATTPLQRVSSWPVRDYLAAAAGSRYASPTLIIIGRVAALHSSFQWLANSRSRELYFPSISKNIAVC